MLKHGSSAVSWARRNSTAAGLAESDTHVAIAHSRARTYRGVLQRASRPMPPDATLSLRVNIAQWSMKSAEATAAGRPVHYVGMDPGINNVITAARVIDLKEGTLYTLPGQQTHPDGRKPITDAERQDAGLPALDPSKNGRTTRDPLFRATQADTEEYGRIQAIALTKGTLDEEANRISAKIQMLEAEHELPDTADPGTRERHKAAFNQRPDVSALRDLRMVVQVRQRNLAVMAILEWLLMREGGVMAERHQGWSRDGALVVVNIGNWQSVRRVGLPAQCSSEILRRCTALTEIHGLPIVWRLQDEYLTSSVCPAGCLSKDGARVDGKANPQGTSQRVAALRKCYGNTPLRDVKYCPCCDRVFARDVLGALNIRAAGMHELAYNTGAWRLRRAESESIAAPAPHTGRGTRAAAGS